MGENDTTAPIPEEARTAAWRLAMALLGDSGEATGTVESVVDAQLAWMGIPTEIELLGAVARHVTAPAPGRETDDASPVARYWALPAEERAALWLCGPGGYGSNDAGEILGLAAGAVLAVAERGRQGVLPPAAGAACPSTARLREYLFEDQPLSVARRIDSHLLACPACKQRAAAIEDRLDVSAAEAAVASDDRGPSTGDPATATLASPDDRRTSDIGPATAISPAGGSGTAEGAPNLLPATAAWLAWLPADDEGAADAGAGVPTGSSAEPGAVVAGDAGSTAGTAGPDAADAGIASVAARVSGPDAADAGIAAAAAPAPGPDAADAGIAAAAAPAPGPNTADAGIATAAAGASGLGRRRRPSRRTVRRSALVAGVALTAGVIGAALLAPGHGKTGTTRSATGSGDQAVTTPLPAPPAGYGTGIGTSTTLAGLVPIAPDPLTPVTVTGVSPVEPGAQYASSGGGGGAETTPSGGVASSPALAAPGAAAPAAPASPSAGPTATAPTPTPTTVPQPPASGGPPPATTTTVAPVPTTQAPGPTTTVAPAPTTSAPPSTVCLLIICI